MNDYHDTRLDALPDDLAAPLREQIWKAKLPAWDHARVLYDHALALAVTVQAQRELLRMREDGEN